MSGNQLRFFKDENLKTHQIEKLNEIFNLFKDDNPKYISRNECLSLKTAENIIFVFSNFDGPAFEHITTLKTRIISVQCMLSSLMSKRKLPRSLEPIYSFSMLDLNVCCTNIEKKSREEIYKKVTLMRGKISKIYTEQVTHLITTEVGSAKYHAAAGMKIHVMLPDWIFNVWTDSERDDVHGMDEKYLKYTCPIFNKYVVCASGFNESKKNEIKQLIESEGGRYCPDLLCSETTHLIIDEAKGDKFSHAKLWKIQVVKSAWVFDSKKSKYCQPEKNYSVEALANTSTPTEARMLKAKLGPAHGIDLSVIQKNNKMPINKDTTKIVNETENATRLSMSCSMLNYSGNVSMLSSTVNNNHKKVDSKDANKTITDYPDLQKELNSIGKIKLTLFDGIGIYCENFESAVNQKLNKICNSGGAIKFDEYNSDVTHVIVNQVNEKLCKSYIELNPELNIVKIDWLIDSCKQNQLAECKSYCVHKNALNSVKTPKKRARPEKITQPITELSTKSIQDSDLNGYLSQYLNAEANIMKPPPPQPESQSNTPQNLNSPKPNVKRLTFNNSGKSTTSINLTDETLEASSASNRLSNINKPQLKMPTNSGIFTDKKIQILGFHESETEGLENELLEKGACILPFDPDMSSIYSRTNDTIDFTIMSVTIPQRISNNNPATVFWVRKCIEQNKIIELTEDVFYQPIPRYNTDKPLASCVITISGYSSHEKDNITDLCRLLGATIQASLSLKCAGQLVANTHLLCKSALGPKYTAAKSWHMPIVGLDWVIDSCVTGNKADEEKYSIEIKRNPKDLIAALTNIRQCDADSTMNCSDNPKASYGLAKSRSSSSNYYVINKNQSNLTPGNGDFLGSTPTQDLTEAHNPNDSSLSCHNESKRQRLDKSKNNDDLKTDNEEVKSDDLTQEIVPEEIRNSNQIEQKNANNNTNNNMPKNINMTPVASFGTPCNPRLKELRRTVEPNQFSPLTGQNNTSMNSDIDSNDQSMDCDKQNKLKLSTPNWMKPDQNGQLENPFQVKSSIDYNKVIENFRTPEASATRKKDTKIPERTNQTPLNQLFTSAITTAHANSQIPNFYSNYATSPAFEYSFDKSYNHDSKEKKVLKNVRVYVSRKLVKQQTEFYEISECLGAEFLWTYDDTCTHFIYSGHLNDTDKELKICKNQGKKIVSAKWIYACKEQGQFVDENLYTIVQKSSATTRHGSVARGTPKKETSTPKLPEKKTESLIKTINTKVNKLDVDQVNEIELKTKNKTEEINFQNDASIIEDIGEETREVEDNDNVEVEDDEVEETNYEINKSENKTTDLDVDTTTTTNKDFSSPSTIPEIIPDSMDIKINFLDQLQDKLATINRNKSIHNSAKPKWSKNTSGTSLQTTPIVHNNKDETELESNNDHNESRKIANDFSKGDGVSESESQLLANYNFDGGNNIRSNNVNSDETVLSEEQALRELNNSRSKWGLSSGGNESNTVNRKKSRSIEKVDYNKTDFENENSSENDSISCIKRKSNKTKSDASKLSKEAKSLKTSNKLNKLDDDDDNDNDGDSPSLIKTKKFTGMEPPASSQIQMTLWKEDTVGTERPTSRSAKSRTVNQNGRSATKKDAIADRIIHASRASSINLK